MKFRTLILALTAFTLQINAQCFNMSNLYDPSVVCTYGDFYNPYEYVGVVSNRHTIHTNPNEKDGVISSLSTIPKGDSISIRLGNSNTGAEAESITFDYIVDIDNPILMLKYAAVMENPDHTPDLQPRLRLEVLNSNGTPIDPACTSFDFIASADLGWNTVGSILWKDWTNIGVDMSPYSGQHVKIRLTNYDCQPGAHFGYAYITLGCSPKKITTTSCGNVTKMNLQAPSGFEYKWYTMSGANQTIISSTQTVNIPVDGSIYYCDINQVGKPECKFTLSASAKTKYPLADFDIKQINSCVDTIYLFNTSTISDDGITKPSPLVPCDYVEWDLGDGRKIMSYDISHIPITYTKGGEYIISLTTYLLDGGCSHTAQKRVKVGGTNDVHEANITEYVCDGNSYFFGGKHLNKTGFYTEVIQLPGGCDSTTTLNLIMCPKYYFTDSTTICQGEELLWHNQKIRTAGKYYAKYHSVYGCDSIYEITVNTYPSYYSEMTEYICGNETYTFAGQVLRNSGVYIDSATTVNGCDSITKLTLNKHDSYLIDQYIETCYNDTFYFSGQLIDKQGIYYDSLLTHHGCDSVYRLIYNKTAAYSFYTEDHICQGETYNFHGRILTQPGFYCDTLKTTSGCDSICQLRLYVGTVYYKEILDTICGEEGYFFGGKIRYTSGVYIDSALTVGGCDSITKLTLTHNKTHIVDKYIETCQNESYYFRGQWLEQPGIYYDTLLTRHGCDSIVKLIYNKTPIYKQHSDVYICKGDVYDFRGELIMLPGTYSDTLASISGCDSIIQVTLKYHPDYFVQEDVVVDTSFYEWRNKIYDKPGIYYDSLRTIHGCDSVFKLVLTFKNQTYIHHAKVLPICADGSIGYMVVNHSGDAPKHYNLFYSQAALNEGFKNITNAPYKSDTITLQIPTYAPYLKPDKYVVSLQLDNGRNKSALYDIEFTVPYPNWVIQQNWQDVVAVLNAQYNGGYYFEGYEWYVNNQPVGINKSYLHLPYLKPGDEVTVHLTRVGDTYAIPTCPLTIHEQTYSNEHPTLVYPNRLSNGQRQITIENGSQGCMYSVYDILGNIIITGKCEANQKSAIDLPNTSGIYFIAIIENNSQTSHTHKVFKE